MSLVVTAQGRFDLGLAGVSALLVGGVIFNAFAMVAWFFGGQMAWTCWLVGFGQWILAFGIFFYFLNSPYPKHKLRR